MPDGFELDLDLTTEKKPSEEIDPKGGGEGSAVQPNGSKAVSADDLADLQKELDAAKADRARLSARATSAETRVTEVERESSTKIASEIEKQLDTQSQLVDTALAGAQGEIEAARALAAKAMEEGKWAEAAEANENLADAKLRFRELTHQKGAIAHAKSQAKVEAAAPKSNLGGRTQAWIAAHPKFNTNPEYRAAALYGHEKAVAAGLVPDSDEYFEMVETVTGDRKAPEAKVAAKITPEGDTDGEGGDGKSSVEARSQSGVAPVTRRTPTGTPAAPGKIKLSGEQVDAADSLFGDPTNPIMYIKDPKERYTYWHTQQQRLKDEGRI